MPHHPWKELKHKMTHTRATDTVAIFSGGMDSTTLVYHLIDEGRWPHLIGFNYGQRHKKELQYAQRTADLLGLPYDIVDLSGLTHLISNSALTAPLIELTDQVVYVGAERKPVPMEVPEGHYAEDNMKATVVPNRNMMMLSIAAAIAVNEKAVHVYTGVHAGDHFIYPDCRPSFIDSVSKAIEKGNQGFGPFADWTDVDTYGSEPSYVQAPFINMSKADIAYRAMLLGVQLSKTWSCYKGGDIHCGKCGTCVERLEAIDEAGMNYQERFNKPFPDPTAYEDTEFWKKQVNQ
jgi:7-cyano-7-deazaguanine synthase